MAKTKKTDFVDVVKLQAEAQKARMMILGKKEKNTNLAKNLRRQIARVLTEQNKK